MITKSNLENMLKSAGFSNTSKDNKKNYFITHWFITKIH